MALTGMEKIGLQAVMLMEQWSQGVSQYLQDQGIMESETERTSKAIAAATEKQSREQAAALQKVGLAFAAVGAAGTALLANLAMTASRTQELGIILDVTAANARRLAEAEGDHARAAGLSADAVRGQVEAVKEQGITTQASSLLVAQLIRFNLDWTKSTELAALAQDAATFAAQDSSEALQGLIHGITTLNPRILRQYGILVSLEQEYAKFASETGRTVNSLDAAEKQAIAFNAVLAQAPAIAGAYDAAMGSASKQIRSLQRDVLEVKEAFGEGLVPALGFAVGALRDLLHWLRDLPEPLQRTVSQVLAMGAGMATLVGSAALLIPKIISLGKALKDLSIITQLASAGLLGPVGLVAGLVAAAASLALYAYNAEKAHQEEASNLLLASDSYRDYIRALRDAGLENYALTESLYDTIRATEEATNATIALAQAQDVLSKQREIAPALAIYEKLPGGLEAWIDKVREMSGALDEATLALYADAEAMTEMARQAGATKDEALEFAGALREIADAEREARAALDEFTRAAEEGVEPWQEIAREAAEAAKAGERFKFKEYVGGLMEMRDGWEELYNAQREYDDQSEDVIKDAAKARVRAEDQANNAIAKARASLVDSLNKLEADHARRVAEILESLNQVAIDLQSDLLEAERKWRADRAKLAQDMAAEIARAEQDLAEKIEDLEIDTQRKREDLQREYADDVREVHDELAEDLEDIEAEHEKTITRMREDHLQDMADLEQEYADKREDILERYAGRVRDIEEKYSLEPPPPDFDELREELQRQLAELEKEGLTSMERQERLQILAQLEELKAKELEALEESRDAELAILEEQLAEEQAARAAAYEAEIAAQTAAYQAQKAEREAEARRRLDELEAQLAREKDALERDRQRRIDDLRREHAREVEEIRANYRQRLAELDTQLAEEKQRLEQAAAENEARLQAQLAAEQANYAERQAELRAHTAAQIAEIERNLAEEKKRIEDNLTEELAGIVNGLAEQSTAFRDAYAEQIFDLERYLADRLARERQYQDDLRALWETGSASKWSKRLALDIMAGFDQGLQPAMATDLTGAMGAFQSSLAALAAPQITLPAMPSVSGGATSISNTYNDSINLTAHYARQQSQASLLDDLTLAQMTMSATPRRRR